MWPESNFSSPTHKGCFSFFNRLLHTAIAFYPGAFSPTSEKQISSAFLVYSHPLSRPQHFWTMAPGENYDISTPRLTAACSASELPRHIKREHILPPNSRRAACPHEFHIQETLANSCGGPGWDRTNRVARHLIYSQNRYLLRDTDPYFTYYLSFR